ncbi:hypothetical protein H5410_006462 [Solanum commersonii]|uniref:Uncharacterized protein n=1 Tax=Solanum commersonii TaxID=4109 RepID=A0A9J6AAB4_SOLCO|nr:hypothetical protein H5410_006462 [Solanum commersonii]
MIPSYLMDDGFLKKLSEQALLIVMLHKDNNSFTFGAQVPFMRLWVICCYICEIWSIVVELWQQKAKGASLAENDDPPKPKSVVTQPP